MFEVELTSKKVFFCSMRFMFLLLAILFPGGAHYYSGDYKKAFTFAFICYFLLFFTCWSGIIFFEFGTLILVLSYLLIHIYSITDFFIIIKTKGILKICKRAKIWKAAIFVFINYLLLFVFLITKNIVLGIQVYLIPSNSMYPELMPNELVLADTRWFSINDDIHTDDIIIFKKSLSDNINYIKRVVAIEGQNLKIENGNLIVDGGIVKTQIKPELPKRMINPGEVFVVGDNNKHSFDSRHWGTIKKENIVAIYKRKLFESD